MTISALPIKQLWIRSCSLLWESQSTNSRKNQCWNEPEWGPSCSLFLNVSRRWILVREDFRKPIQSWVPGARVCVCVRACACEWSEVGSRAWSHVMGCCLVAAAWWPAGEGWWHEARDAVWPPFPLTRHLSTLVGGCGFLTHTWGEGILGEMLRRRIRTLKQPDICFHLRRVGGGIFTALGPRRILVRPR